MKDFFWAIGVPLSWLWAWVAWAVGKYRQSRAVSLGPVTVSIGNVHSGGSGKTPLTLEVLDRYRDRNPVLVTRGYGSKAEKSGAEVDLNSPKGARLYGDEPWMVARLTGLPVLVGARRSRWRDRLTGAAHGLVVLDDGFQHRQVARHLDLVLVSTRFGVEENFCLPFGPLREPVSALRRAGAVVLLEEPGGDDRWRGFLGELAPGVPVFSARREFRFFTRDGVNAEEAPMQAVGFAGIAWPEGFFQALGERCKVLETRAFPDHHDYREADLRSLMRAAQGGGASLVTTDKDWYKVSPWFNKEGVPVYSLRTGLRVEPAFWEFLNLRLEER